MYYNQLGQEITQHFDYHYKFENNEWFVLIDQSYIPIKIIDETLEIIKHILIKHKENIRNKKLKRILV